MIAFVCGRVLPDLDWPEVEGCCYGSAIDGPAGCTCWQPVFNGDQQPIDEKIAAWLAAGVEPNVRPGGRCADCAYRPGSPEMRGDHDVVGDPEMLQHLAETGQRFWCHDGLVKPVKWVHPSGAEVRSPDAGYCPPIKEGVPYRLDGQPAYLCAGWEARRRAARVPP